MQAALRGSFAGAAQLENLLRDLMRLYAEETRLLSHAVELPKLLVPAREKIAHRLLHIMREVGARLAGDLARLVYRDR